MVLFNVYAPQSGRPYCERQLFYAELAQFVERTSSHGPKVICGDMNSRLYRGAVIGRVRSEEELRFFNWDNLLCLSTNYVFGIMFSPEISTKMAIPEANVLCFPLFALFLLFYRLAHPKSMRISRKLLQKRNDLQFIEIIQMCRLVYQ